MDAQTITQIISSVGFPIVAACAMFYLYDKTVKDLTATLGIINATLGRIELKLDKMEDDV